MALSEPPGQAVLQHTATVFSASGLRQYPVPSQLSEEEKVLNRKRTLKDRERGGGGRGANAAQDIKPGECGKGARPHIFSFTEDVTKGSLSCGPQKEGPTHWL